MAVEVAQVQKKENPLTGMVFEMGKSLVMDKIKGGGAAAKDDGSAPPADQSSAASQGSNPRDRRMGGYR